MLAVHRRILIDMLSIPTAPFAEHQVLAFLEAFCSRRPALKLTRDAAGNLLVHLRQGGLRIKRPICLTAHLDHPGFVADRMVAKGVVQAFWRGGVPPEYFPKAKVRFDVNGSWVCGTIRETTLIDRNGQMRVNTARISVPQEIGSGAVGMWDFPDPVIRNGRIYARGCDDIAGAAAMVCCIDELVRRKKPADIYFLFTRAEEVGFIGAIAAAKARTIPSKCVVVAMETSSERPHAKMGDGPILRVGDKASTWTPAATAYCHRVARELALQDKSFQFQRKLMDGGTCESSAYYTLGYDATGICIALGNYHNIDAKRGRLGPEYVNVNDFENVVKWFTALATSTIFYTGRDDALDAQIAGLEKSWRGLLRRSISRPC